MRIFNYSEARQNFAAVLNKALEEEVIIKRKDGTRFKIVPLNSKQDDRSPFDIDGVESEVTRDEIINAVRESRSYTRET